MRPRLSCVCASVGAKAWGAQKSGQLMISSQLKVSKLTRPHPGAGENGRLSYLRCRRRGGGGAGGARLSKSQWEPQALTGILTSEAGQDTPFPIFFLAFVVVVVVFNSGFTVLSSVSNTD